MKSTLLVREKRLSGHNMRSMLKNLAKIIGKGAVDQPIGFSTAPIWLLERDAGKLP